MMNLVKAEEKYISALHFDWLTRFYDPIMQWTLREQTFKRLLIQQANIKVGHRVLDLGCGTATLTIMLKEVHPETEVIGLDGDDKALAIAQSKISAAGLEIELKKGMSFELDFPDHFFDDGVFGVLRYNPSVYHNEKFVQASTILSFLNVLLNGPGGFHHELY